MKRLVLITSIVALFVAGTGAAQGAPAPKHLGEVAGSATAFGNCGCSAVQFGDFGLANNSYPFPYSGVITASGFYVGELVSPGDWVQMRSFARSGTGHATVNGDGTQHMLQGLTTKATSSFYERLPVSASNVLGARYSIGNASITATPTYFNTPSTADEVLGTTTSLAVGDSFESTTSKKLRVNVEAVLEPDEDHDGYGDVSQDLCPGSPIGGSPCSGSLFGSDLQEAHAGGGGAGFEPLLVQKTVDGASTALPFDGVVVRWRVLTSNSGSFRIRVLSQEASGLKVLNSSPVEPVSVESSPPIGKVTSFPARLPIPAGSYVGLASPTQSLPPIALHVSGANATEFHDAPDGSLISAPGTARSWEVAYDADVEPDADHDGYGDITQDSCPEASTTHEGTCPPKSTGGGGGTTHSFLRVEGLRVVPKSFRVKVKGASAKLKLGLSEAATVAFGIEAEASCARGKKRARCRRKFHEVQTFRKKLPAGSSVIPFSARLHRHGEEATLSPGQYRIVALPSAGKLTGPGKIAEFTILPPRRGHAR